MYEIQVIFLTLKKQKIQGIYCASCESAER